LVFNGGGVAELYLGKRRLDLGFSRRRDLRGRRAMSEVDQGAHITPRHGQGGATLGCGWSLTLLRLSFGLRLVSGKIGGSGFVSSNFENISRVTFLKHKTAENRELALWHLVNRLVPENA
jgi:hypothetical protein